MIVELDVEIVPSNSMGSFVEAESVVSGIEAAVDVEIASEICVELASIGLVVSVCG